MTDNCSRQIHDFHDSLSFPVYVNHRPAFGISPTELEDAFAKIGRLNENGEAEIDRGALLEILQRKGGC